MSSVIDVEDFNGWRKALSAYDKVDVCHLPEYHFAYETRFAGAKALLWNFEKGEHKFSYPFLLSPVLDSGYFDVSGVYGFAGPLATSVNRDFLNDAWSAFDHWANEKKVISEFIRFSVYSNNTIYAHEKAKVEANRPISVSKLPKTSDEYFEQLPSKTRNMIRRAGREGLTVREVKIHDELKSFRQLYERTMARNQATTFFAYDDSYYKKLLSLPAGEVVLHAVYKEKQMVAAAIGLTHKRFAFYHLGASDHETSKIGAGNLVLFDLARGLIEKGVEFYNVGGGRTTSSDDPLFRFKESNGTSVEQFYIGKRILNQNWYDDVVSQWKKLNKNEPNLNQLQFYR